MEGIQYDYGRYPRTGPNYQTWGEQPGLVYDYARDAYFVAPAQYEETYAEHLPPEEQPPSSPGLGEILIPVAGGAAAIEAGRQIMKNAAGEEGWVESGWNYLTKDAATEAGTEAATNVASNQFADSAYDQAISSAIDDAAAQQGSNIATGGVSQSGVNAGVQNTGGGGVNSVEGLNTDGVIEQQGSSNPYLNAATDAAALYGFYKGAESLSPQIEDPDSSVAKAFGYGAVSGAGAGASIGTGISPGVGTAIGAAGGALVGGTYAGLSSALKDTERIYVPESVLSSPLIRQYIPELDQLTQDQQRAVISLAMQNGLITGMTTGGNKREDLSDEEFSGLISKYSEGEGAQIFNPKLQSKFAGVPTLGGPGSLNPKTQKFMQDVMEDEGGALQAAEQHNQKAMAVYNRLQQMGYEVPMTQSWGAGSEMVPDLDAIINSLPLSERVRLAPEFYGSSFKEFADGLQEAVALNQQQGIQGEAPPPIEQGDGSFEQPRWTPGTKALPEFGGMGATEPLNLNQPPIVEAPPEEQNQSGLIQEPAMQNQAIQRPLIQSQGYQVPQKPQNPAAMPQQGSIANLPSYGVGPSDNIGSQPLPAGVGPTQGTPQQPMPALQYKGYMPEDGGLIAAPLQVSGLGDPNTLGGMSIAEIMAQANMGQVPPPGQQLPPGYQPRTNTLSPGIGLDGKPIRY